MRFASGLTLLGLVLVCPSIRGEAPDTREAQWLDATAQACAHGSAAQCAARRQAIATGAFQLGSSPPPAGGTSDKLSAAKVQNWIQAMRNKLASGNGGPFAQKLGALLDVLQAHGGDIKAALSSGQLLPLAQAALGVMKDFVVKKHLGDGHLIAKIQAELPQLAARLQSNQMNVDSVIQKLKGELENSSPLKALAAGTTAAPGPASPSAPTVASATTAANQKFNSRLDTLLPPP